MLGSYAELRRRAADFGQEHVFHYWERLTADQRDALLHDVSRIDFALVNRLANEGVSATVQLDPARIEPPPVYPADPPPEQREHYAAARAAGERLLRENKVAALVVAGGQGTRLGFDAPKGTFPISPIRKKTLFQLFAEAIRATCARYECRLPWLIMTSSATDAATRLYFAEQNYHGLNPDEVRFFEQGVMPAVDEAGKILLAEPHRIALSPNGHGGTLAALRESGVLAELAARGIETLSYFQVDNPLVSPADPLFLGLHHLAEAQVSSIAVPKADDLEKVGNFVRMNGKVQVIEYSDLPESVARAKNPDGTRKLNAGSIAIHCFERAFVESLTAGGSLSLPWHVARKKVPYVDLASGTIVNPDYPNAIKFEMFIFDALPLAERTIVVERPRLECFSPVKNAEGVDSPATSRRDMIRRALTWLEAAGAELPAPQAATPAAPPATSATAPQAAASAAPGEPVATVEISPLMALDAAQLKERLKLPMRIVRGDTVYLE